MTTVTNLNKSDVKSFLEKIRYGSNLVSYKNQETRDYLLFAIKVLNEYLGGEPIEEKPAVITETIDGEWVDTHPEGVFNVLYRLRGVQIPVINENNFLIKEYARKASETKSMVSFALDFELHRLAGRLAYGLGIKFGKNSFGQCYFSAEEKGLPVSKQIQNAYFSGADKIDFDSQKNNSATIRVYASQLSNQIGRKVRCAYGAGVISVIFKEPSQDDVIRADINKLYLKASELFGKNEAITMFDEVLYPYKWDEEDQEKPEIESENTIDEDNEPFVEPSYYLKPEPKIVDDSDFEDDDF